MLTDITNSSIPNILATETAGYQHNDQHGKPNSSIPNILATETCLLWRLFLGL